MPGIVLRPTGEIDLATADGFRASVDSALAADPPALVFDLAEVAFLDSSGMAVIVAAWKAQRNVGRAVAVINARPIVRRAMTIVGLDVLFDVTAIP